VIINAWNVADYLRVSEPLVTERVICETTLSQQVQPCFSSSFGIADLLLLKARIALSDWFIMTSTPALLSPSARAFIT